MTNQPKKLDPKAVFRILSDDGAFATTLLYVCLITYGEESFYVDPLELIMRLQEDFNVQLTDSNENKLKSILLATSTNIFYENPEGFRGTCETLTNGDPAIEVVEILTVPEALWGIWEVELNHGSHDLAPAVQAILDSIIENEVLDPSSPGQPQAFDHVWGYLEERRNSLIQQLAELGVPTSEIPPINAPDPLRDAQAEIAA